LIGGQFAPHADQHVFTASRSGRVGAARPFAQIRRLTNQVPHPESLACLAGAALSILP
jgi:hypothetical protein